MPFEAPGCKLSCTTLPLLGWLARDVLQKGAIVRWMGPILGFEGAKEGAWEGIGGHVRLMMAKIITTVRSLITCDQICRNVRTCASDDALIRYLPRRDMKHPQPRANAIGVYNECKYVYHRRKMTARFGTVGPKTPKHASLFGIVAPLVLGACMQIIGIEDPKRIEDKPGGDTSGAGSSSSSTGGGGSSSSTGGNSSGGTSGPWISWPMPNPVSAQLDYPVNYSFIGNDVVKDDVTGLQWQRTVTAPLGNWQDAVAHCDNLVYGGYDDWRLPWRIELVSLIDYTRSNPAIDPIFANGSSDAFWTATRWAGDTSNAWIVYFFDGDTYYTSTIETCAVRCVRSN